MSQPGVDAVPGTPLRLDGGTATELERAGIGLRAPWWTTRALLSEDKRRILRDVHEQFLTAGAQVITANTFRCNLRALRLAGLRDAGQGWMVHAAAGVALAARNRVGTAQTRIVGSMAPVEDAYRPDLVPADDELRAEHRWLATELIRAGVDTVLIETMTTERETRIAVAEVLAAGGAAWVSFACSDNGRLLSGEGLAEVARAVEADGATAVLVNCTAPTQTEQALRVLSEVCRGPIGAYPNIEDRAGAIAGNTDSGPLAAAIDPEAFGDLIAGWREQYPLAMVGGCCGTSPQHLAAMTERLTSARLTSAPARLG